MGGVAYWNIFTDAKTFLAAASSMAMAGITRRSGERAASRASLLDSSLMLATFVRGGLAIGKLP